MEGYDMRKAAIGMCARFNIDLDRAGLEAVRSGSDIERSIAMDNAAGGSSGRDSFLVELDAVLCNKPADLIFWKEIQGPESEQCGHDCDQDQQGQAKLTSHHFQIRSENLRIWPS